MNAFDTAKMSDAALIWSYNDAHKAFQCNPVPQSKYTGQMMCIAQEISRRGGQVEKDFLAKC